MGTDPNCTWKISNSRLIKHVQLGSVPICTVPIVRLERLVIERKQFSIAVKEVGGTQSKEAFVDVVVIG